MTVGTLWRVVPHTPQAWNDLLRRGSTAKRTHEGSPPLINKRLTHPCSEWENLAGPRTEFITGICAVCLPVQDFFFFFFPFLSRLAQQAEV